MLPRAKHNTACNGSSVSLESLAGHAVDDAVATRIHEPYAVADGGDGDRKHDHRPQDDVEDDRILVRVDRVDIQLPLQTSVTIGRLSPTEPNDYIKSSVFIVLSGNV